MIYAAREHKYIPIMWILLTGKTSRCYIEAISWVSRCLPGGLCPDVAFGGTDFEPAFFGAIKIFFVDTFLVGCHFHLKQAVCRRLLKMAMHRCVVDAILSMLDYTPMLPDHKIAKKRVPYLKRLVKEYLKSQRKGKLLLEYIRSNGMYSGSILKSKFLFTKSILGVQWSQKNTTNSCF